MKPYLSGRQIRGLALPDPSPGPPAPVLNPWDEPGIGLGPFDPGAQTSLGCNAHRVQLAGGALNTLLVDPEVTPFEQLYRRMPEEGMFLPGVSPSRPFTFELGAFRVPETFCLLLIDLRANVFRFSGVDAGDTVPVEAQRFSSIMGFLPTVDQRQLGNLLYELDPIPIQSEQQAFTAPISALSEVPPALANIVGLSNNARFNIAAATSFATAAGAGTQLQPQRPRRYGPIGVPFTLIVRPGATFQVRCVVFRPIPSPIAFIEYDIAGMLMPETWLNTMMQCMRPLSNASGGPGSLGGGPR